MSQRGGSVVTYVRYGDRVYSPIIDKGEADYILSFELLEAARYAEFLAPAGKIITNSRETMPMPVITGAMAYPEHIIEKLQACGTDIDGFVAQSLAEEAGSVKAVNLVLLGRLSRDFGFAEEEWMAAIEKSVPAKFLEMNKKAFLLGRNC